MRAVLLAGVVACSAHTEAGPTGHMPELKHQAAVWELQVSHERAEAASCSCWQLLLALQAHHNCYNERSSFAATDSGHATKPPLKSDS
jgi:hypothetical protein